MQKLRQIALRLAALAALIVLVVYASDKPPVSVERVMQSMLFFDPATRTLYPPNLTASGDTASAARAAATYARESASAATYISTLTTNLTALTATAIPTASAYTIDCDWHYSTREPAALNYLSQELWATPTNINGVLCEDHYIQFSSLPSEAPSTVFEYQDLLGETHLSKTFTNSFPTLHGITLPSGVHSCYWFRCEVPVAFTNRLRTWEGEVRFGGPVNSEYGFDVAGVFIIDDGNSIWQGRTVTKTFGTNTVEFSNGIAISPLVAALATEPDLEERGILHALGQPYRWTRSLLSTPKINLTSNKITKTTWQGSETYKLAFPVNKDTTK